MKIQIFLPIVCFFSSVLAHASDYHSEEDSINVIMDLEIDTKFYEERRGDFVSDVRLYTTERETTIKWTHEGDYYLYTLRDDNHDERGFNLFNAIAIGGMSSYIFEIKPKKSVRFKNYYTVIGLQIEYRASKK